MKKTFLLFALTTFTTAAFADSVTTGISDAADGVVTYMPYVRALCYAVAAIIAVVGAVAVYYTMQTNPQNTAKRISMTVGSALTFVCLSLALPQFFGVDGSVFHQAQVLVQVERQVQAMDSLLLTKEVSRKVVLLLQFPHLPIEIGCIFQMAQRWK